MEKKTEQRLLESACEVFAEKGFRRTTVAEICAKAQANVAAVNYYFRNKENLYRAAWGHASEVTEAAYGFEGVDEGDDAAWLEKHISNRVRSIFDGGPAGWFPRILHQEFSSRSSMAEELRRQFLAPRLAQVEEVVGRLLGERSTNLQVRCCTMNIVGLHAFLNMGEEVRHRMFEGADPSEEQIDAVVVQMQVFAMNAVTGIRTAMNEGRLN